MLKRVRKHSKKISILSSLIGLVLVFLGGLFSSDTLLEKNAEYVTNVVLNQTSGKPLCALTIGKTDESGPIPDPYSEFNNTYGTFMQQRIAFASAVNPDKVLSINFKNIQTNNNITKFH